jgi:hypothetical protein
MVSVLAFIALCAIILMCCHIMTTDYNDLKFSAMAFLVAGTLDLSTKADVAIDKFGNGWNLLWYCILLICLIIAYIFESKKEKDDETKNN